MTEYKGGFPKADVAWLENNGFTYLADQYYWELPIENGTVSVIYTSRGVLCTIHEAVLHYYPKCYDKTAEKAFMGAFMQLSKAVKSVDATHTFLLKRFKTECGISENQIEAKNDNDEFVTLCWKYEELVKNIAPCRICGKKPKQFIAGETAGIACEDDFSNNVDMDIKMSNCKQTMKDMIEDVKSSIALIEAWNAKQIIK